MTPPAPAIEAVGLSRAFGRRLAVDGVDLRVGRGEVVAVFGPNGAGKTTLLRLLSGLLKPTRGEARIDGVVIRGDRQARGRVGLISHQSLLYPALTARENVALAATLYGVADPDDAALRALSRMNVAERADTVVRHLSRGLQQRVSIARAIVHEPNAVLLDEPFTGLDAIGASALSGVLASLRASGAAQLLVTHNVAEGLALATSAVVLREGRVVDRSEFGGEKPDPVQYAARYQSMLGIPVTERVA